MRHATAQQLSAFLDGALTGVSKELVTRHLAACADCRERHALWHIYDEVLQRVLSWEPNDRTMEEASARVELTLTAERRGLPPPEFTSVLHPMIAASAVSAGPAPGVPVPGTGPGAPASASAPFPALPPLTAPPAPAASAAQPPPSPPAPPAPIANAPPAVPSVLAFPLDTPGMAPPASPPPAPAPAPRFQRPSAPPAGYTPPISVHEDLRTHAQPSAVPWDRVPLPMHRRRHRVLITCGVLLALAVLASPWMPDVIRIRLPESFEPRVPRVEFVRHPAADAALDPKLQLAERTSSAPPPEPWRALPAPVDSGAVRPAATDEPAVEAGHAVTPPEVIALPPAEPRPDAAATKPAPRSRPRNPAAIPTRTRPAPPSEPTAQEDETGTAGAEHSTTFVPVSVKTEVVLTPTRPATQPSSAPAPTVADTAGAKALPLLCGEVLDESGAPIEGARVQFTSPPLTVRTDKRGRFCVACPAGERTFLVDAPGFSPVTRGVELDGATFETHITLTAIR